MYIDIYIYTEGGRTFVIYMFIYHVEGMVKYINMFKLFLFIKKKLNDKSSTAFEDCKAK